MMLLLMSASLTTLLFPPVPLFPFPLLYSFAFYSPPPSSWSPSCRPLIFSPPTPFPSPRRPQPQGPSGCENILQEGSFMHARTHGSHTALTTHCTPLPAVRHLPRYPPIRHSPLTAQPPPAAHLLYITIYHLFPTGSQLTVTLYGPKHLTTCCTPLYPRLPFTLSTIHHSSTAVMRRYSIWL